MVNRPAETRAVETSGQELAELLARMLDLDARVREQAVQLAELNDLQERVNRQEAELACLRAFDRGEPSNERAEPAPRAAESPRASRRHLLGNAAAAMAALGLAGAVGGRAEAAPAGPTGTNDAGDAPGMPLGATGSGQPLTVGKGAALDFNQPSGNTNADVTQLTNFGTANPNSALFLGVQAPTTARQQSAVADLLGVMPAGSNVAVAGQSQFLGVANTRRNYGVVGQATDGVGVAAAGVWQVQLVKSAATTFPTADTAGNAAPDGALWYGANPNRLDFNFSTGTRRIAQAGMAGVLVPVTPVRVLDTRADATATGPIGFRGSDGAPLAGSDTFPASPSGVTAAATKSYKIGGQSFGTAAAGNQITFSTLIRGILCNVTAVGTPAGGFVLVYSGDLATTPSGSTLNPITPIAFNFWYTQVGTTSNNITVVSVGDQPRDVIVDVVGYFI